MNATMIDELEEYYKKNGILSTSFECKHKNDCSSGCTKFTGPKSAYVSSGYEKGDLPRLLFISLDSGSGSENSEKRLPKTIRAHGERENIGKLPKNLHWYRTHELAWYILKSFNQQLNIEEAKNYFAHVNSAKCSMNKDSRKEADKKLFKNCREYLQGEIEILNPLIIVTQGNEARDALRYIRENKITKYDRFASIIELNQKRIFWLHTYHPNYWTGFNKQRSFNKDNGNAEGWLKYSDLMREFVDGVNI